MWSHSLLWVDRFTYECVFVCVLLYEGRSKSLNHSIIVLKLLIRNFHVKLYNTLSMNVQNLEVLALLFFDMVTIARNTLLPSVFPAYKSVFKEIGRALSDPRLHCRLDSVIVFRLLASQIVLQGSKHVKIWWGQIGAVRWMGQYSPPPCSNRSCGGVCRVRSCVVLMQDNVLQIWTLKTKSASQFLQRFLLPSWIYCFPFRQEV